MNCCTLEMKMKRILPILFLLCPFAACLKPPDYSVIPSISLISIYPEQARANFDSGHIVFSFQDGDGDLGALPSDTTPNVFVTDSRTGFVYPIQIPYITPEGKVKEISGTISITLPEFNCIPGDSTIDTLSYAIILKDRAGHSSNSIRTPVVSITCQ